MVQALPALAQGYVVFHLAALAAIAALGIPLWRMLKHLRGPTIKGLTENASFFARREKLRL